MYDYHVYSGSASGVSPQGRAIIKAAAHFGLKEICFTNGLDSDSEGDTTEKGLNIPAYIKDIKALDEEFAGTITAKAGVEASLKLSALEDISNKLDGKPFDYILASRYELEGFNYDMRRAEGWKHYTKEYVFRQYILQLSECVRKFEGYNCLGQLTYYSRFCPYDDKMMRYADAAVELDELFRLVIPRGKGIEINTSLYRRFGFMVPDYEILKRYKQLGGEIVVTGSDAHLPNFAGANFREAYDMLKSAGFKYVCTFEKQKPIFNRI